MAFVVPDEAEALVEMGREHWKPLSRSSCYEHDEVLSIARKLMISLPTAAKHMISTGGWRPGQIVIKINRKTKAEILFFGRTQFGSTRF